MSNKGLKHLGNLKAQFRREVPLPKPKRDDYPKTKKRKK